MFRYGTFIENFIMVFIWARTKTSSQLMMSLLKRPDFMYSLKSMHRWVTLHRMYPILVLAKDPQSELRNKSPPHSTTSTQSKIYQFCTVASFLYTYVLLTLQFLFLIETWCTEMLNWTMYLVCISFDPYFRISFILGLCFYDMKI